MNAIEIKGLSKSFRGLFAVNNLNMTVPKGSICLSLGIGMFLFMVISIASPLDAGIIHIVLCLVGSVGFAVGMGTISNLILKKTSLV